MNIDLLTWRVIWRIDRRERAELHRILALNPEYIWKGTGVFDSLGGGWA